MFAGQFSAGGVSGLMASEGKMTTIMIISSIVASTGGLLFGYDIGVTGGVTSTDNFLIKFFPNVYRKMMMNNKLNSNNYCKPDDKGLKLFQTSSYLAGITGSFFASYTTRKFGRKITMSVAGVFFIVGVIFSSTAQDLAMLIVGRILFGCGIGLANQAIPIYLSEIAPTRKRGAINILFQLNVTIGILLGNIVNYATTKIGGGWGWRLSLGLAGIPAAILTIGSFFIVETPNSLIERGHLEKGKSVLRKIRDSDHNIEPELLELVEASRICKQLIKQSSFRILLSRRNRPQLIIAMAIQTFQQLTGIDPIMFYVPVFLTTIGYENDGASLYSALITGSFNVISTVVSMFFVDREGRRKLLLESGVHMFLSHVLMAIILGIKVKEYDDGGNLSHGSAIFVVILVCTFVCSYAWSWGPLGWLIPSEIFPLEIRSIGQSVSVCVNFMFTFATTQAFLPMLCDLKFGIFLFFSAWIVFMNLFVIFFVPETKNIPIEDMRERVWKRHWFWKRFLDPHDHGDHQDARNW